MKKSKDSAKTNVNNCERKGSVLAGGFLLIYALKKFSLKSFVYVAISAAFIHRGLTGKCPLYTALDLSTAETVREKVPAVSPPAGKRSQPAAPVKSRLAGKTVKKKKTPAFDDWTKEQLYRKAQELDIPGRSRMSKAELVKALKKAK